MSLRSLLRALVVLSLVFALGSAAIAVIEPRSSSLDAKVVRVGPVRDGVVHTGEALADESALDEFRAQIGGEWWGRLVAASPRASLVSGSGVAVLPAAGSEVSLEELEAWFRGLILENRALLAPEDGKLVLSRARSTIADRGRIAVVDLDLEIGGHPVRGARVFARLNSGRLIQIGTQLLGGRADAATAALSVEDATEALFAYIGGRTEADRLHGEPEQFYLPVREPGGALRYRLVHEIAFRRAGEQPTWTARVAADDGEIVEFFDGNFYGDVTGGTYARTVTDPEVERPLFDAEISDGTITDFAGHYVYGGGLVSTGLDGRYFRTSCEACENPPQLFAETDLGLGWLLLGSGGSDQIGNGLSTPAERNSFFHLSLVRRQAKKWLDLGWFDTTITTNVNIDDTCNAFYNGTVNFYRSGGGCNNTGEIADVMQHEWGHGLDNNTQGGDSATGEGTADHVAFLLQHDSVIGPYFRTTGAGVRDVNKDTSSRGLLTYSNVLEKCGTGSCSGPRGRECHCEGEIYGQTGWDLAQALIAKHGFNTGWQEYERIFYLSLPQAGTYVPNEPDSIYDAYLAVDDDDGNLANGTPNGQEIYDAFHLHEIAGDPVTSSTYCARPEEPVVSTTTGCSDIQLSWNAVPNAVEYNVLRQPIAPDLGYLPVATVTSTSFTDAEVAPGATYYYLVEALDAAGCRSTIESVVTATGPAKPVVGIVDLETDDVPAGNRSGTVDPGESVDVFLTLQNISEVAATGLIGTIATSEPGVTVEVPTQPFADLGGLEMTTNVEGFRFALDETVACGETIDFTFTVTDDSGCAVDTQYFSVRVGVDELRQSDTFETDSGWIFDAAGSTATSGDWTRGVPDATGYQPGSDSDDEGTFCWYTAPNAGGDGSDDVDDGEVVLLSPAFDLTGLEGPKVAYSRWFGNRDTGEDPDDYYWVEVSDDDGATWATVEKLGSEDSAPAWTPVAFELDGLISLTDRVRFRVRVSDGTLDGNLIEGAFDDFRILEPYCDDTPPCFVAPTFAGLESATPGPDCAEATLGWSPASSNCVNAEISYSVYRSTDAVFSPGADSLIASGLTETEYLDTLLAPDEIYHYVVRAFDSRSGEDSNLERHPVTAPTSPDTTAPIFDGLVSAAPGAGCGEAELDWNAALETCSVPVVYRVYRSTSPGFVPSAETLVAETTAVALTDAGLAPDLDYHYIVRAVDQAALADANTVERTVTATVLPETLSFEDFESGAAGWGQGGTNDASTGLWELGDPVETAAQPGDCPSGTSCWVTGASGPGVGDNDIDGGTTTLISELFGLTGMSKPAIRYTRYYSNDAGSTPGTDTWTVEISNDDGASWSVVEETQESDQGLVFTTVEYPLPEQLTPTEQMRVRFIASDLGDGSVVEAEVDDFETVDLAGGCDDCAPPPRVETILLSLDGDDVVLDWTGDPVNAGRFKVYTLSGADFSDASLLGAPTEKSYRHADGAAYGDLTSYRVSALNACAEEGALE